MIAKRVLSNSQELPDKIAIISNGISCTYKELRNKIENATTILNSLPLENGEPLAIVMPNCIEFIEFLFASELTNHCAVLLSDKFKSVELNYHINNSGVRYVISSNGNDFTFNECGFDIVRKFDSFIIWIQNREKNEIVYRTEDFICQVTSGTNGIAKGIVRTQSAVCLEIEETIQCTNLCRPDIFLTIPPICHSYGLIAGTLLPLYIGATLILIEKFIASNIISNIVSNQITVLFAVPFMYQMICDRFINNGELASLRLCFSAGAPIKEEIFNKFHMISGIYITQDYGSTETGVMCINNESKKYPKSVGKPVGKREFRIISDDGTDCQFGKQGHFITKSPCDTARYLYPEESNSQFSNGWLNLGDYGSIDSEGYLYVKGRIANFINVAGMKVDPSEVENVIMEIPGIKEVVALGKAANPYGEVVKVFIVASDNVSKLDIIEYCRNKISHYKIPKMIEFVESIPKSPTGKIQRKYLV